MYVYRGYEIIKKNSSTLLEALLIYNEIDVTDSLTHNVTLSFVNNISVVVDQESSLRFY